ncbi:MAG: DNA gyrase/topoisomerase IV subunit A, partial [Bacteroidetes bacterium]|nr:DNA gyrase/topoisomerase IV subunit A [Bacteroidota bacterium]
MSKKEDKKPKMKGNGNAEEGLHNVVHLSGMYEKWFLDYASYVILERSVPSILDGLKPVQRRILHAMKEMDDGRFNKVANIIGQTMQYHPHGDASIGDALVNLGQKDLLIETQGNWGDVRTGDAAAAPRYIEARLSKLANEIAFNAKTTEWQLSYDSRKNEPVNLPMKFPLLLAQGVEGIAVGLATKIMPHNFIELCKGSIDVLKGKRTNIMPDFPTGGLADFTDYNKGKKGGKIRVRAKIETVDKKKLVIHNIPFGVTTTSLIESVVKANENGKIKIKRVIDNTAAEVEIFIELPSGVSPDVTVDALYAFTDCEVSISPNPWVIVDDKPVFLNVNEILKLSTENTRRLLKWELENRKNELAEKWHFMSLERIFIEKRIYRDIEESKTWEAVIAAIDKGLKPHIKKLKRKVTEDDIVRLTEIKIKRISKYDTDKAREDIEKLEAEMKVVAKNLKNLTDYAIAYFINLIEKYGEGKERKTVIKTFDSIEAKKVAAANVRLYANYKEGFVGYSLRKDEFICECSDLDDIIAFTKDGRMLVSKVSAKRFVGDEIIFVDVWKKGSDRMVYNTVYFDGESGRNYVKRFNVTSITRDKEYFITKGNKGSKVIYLTANPNGETEVINIQLSQGSKARIKNFDYDFKDLAIKGRGSQGNIVSKYPIRKISQKEVGASTFGGVKIWYDKTVGRLNKEERGDYLGSFNTNDFILVIHYSGHYELSSFDLSNRYEPEEILLLEKFDPDKDLMAVHYDGNKKAYFIKRFFIE